MKEDPENKPIFTTGATIIACVFIVSVIFFFEKVFELRSLIIASIVLTLTANIILLFLFISPYSIRKDNLKFYKSNGSINTSLYFNSLFFLFFVSIISLGVINILPNPYRVFEEALFLYFILIVCSGFVVILSILHNRKKEKLVLLHPKQSMIKNFLYHDLRYSGENKKIPDLDNTNSMVKQDNIVSSANNMVKLEKFSSKIPILLISPLINLLGLLVLFPYSGIENTIVEFIFILSFSFIIFGNCYVWINRSNSESTYLSTKTLLISIIIITFLLILSLLVELWNDSSFISRFIIQTVISLACWGILGLCIPTRSILVDFESKTLTYVIDYRTKIVKVPVRIHNVEAINITIIVPPSIIGLFKQSIIVDFTYIQWELNNIFSIPYTFFRLIEIFGEFPLKIRVNGFCSLLRPSSRVIEGRSSTEVDYRIFNPSSLLKNAFKSIDSQMTEVEEVNTIKNLLESFYRVEFKDFKWSLSARSRGSPDINMKVLGFLGFFSGFLFLLLFILGGLVVFQFIPMKNSMDLVELKIMVILITVLGFLSFFSFLVFIFWFLGRDNYIFNKSDITYSYKVFDKNLVSLKIPKSAIEDIDVYNQVIFLRLLGGDSIKIWEGSTNEQKTALIALKSLVCSD